MLATERVGKMDGCIAVRGHPPSRPRLAPGSSRRKICGLAIEWPTPFSDVCALPFELAVRPGGRSGEKSPLIHVSIKVADWMHDFATGACFFFRIPFPGVWTGPVPCHPVSSCFLPAAAPT